jgi:hypothetical protein
MQECDKKEYILHVKVPNANASIQMNYLIGSIISL